MSEELKDKLQKIVDAFPKIGIGAAHNRKYGTATVFIEGQAFRSLPEVEIVARFRQSLPDNAHLMWYSSHIDENGQEICASPNIHISSESDSIGRDAVWGMFASEDWSSGRSPGGVAIPSGIG